MTLYTRLQAVMAKHPELSPPEALHRAVVAHRLFLMALACDQKHPDANALIDAHLAQREQAAQPQLLLGLHANAD